MCLCVTQWKKCGSRPITANPKPPRLRADRSHLQAQLFDCLSLSVHEWMFVVFGKETAFCSGLRNVHYAVSTTPESQRGNRVRVHPMAGEQQHLGKNDGSPREVTSETPAGGKTLG